MTNKHKKVSNVQIGDNMRREIIKQLYTLTPLELKQKKTGQFIEDLPSKALSTPTLQTRTLNNYFFQNRDIYLSKHNRFAPYPLHTHTFLELNYMLRGSANQIINGKKVHLKQGDLLLLDVGTSHQIAQLNENDILINILFRDNNISLDLLKDVKGRNNVLFDFLLKKDSQQNFLIFDTHKSYKLGQTLEAIIEEYYENQEFSELVIKSYLNILFTLLIRNFQIHTTSKEDVNQQLVLKLLRDISQEYATISLQTLAERYAYNRNYLSNIFKQEVGQTFSTVLTRQRIMQAHNLLLTSDLPITAIMSQVGLSNKSFFYRKYEEIYQTTPQRSRQQQDAQLF